MEERERRKLNTTEKDGDNDNDDDNDDDDNKLDICSDTFDPLLALYSPAVPLPFPHIKCFNNVSEYESFLRGGRGRAKPENVERRRRIAAKKEGADPARIERLRRLMVRNVPAAEGREAGDEEAGGGSGSSSSAPQRRKQRIHKNVVVRMQLNKGSPLGELYRCVEEKIRVKVHIRTFKGLRGVCSGFVVAFDKFWNLAMVDVDETYRDPLLGDALYHEKALTVTRLFEKLKLQESSEETARTGKGKGKKAQPPQPDPGVGPGSDPRRLSKSSVPFSEAGRGAEAGGPTEAPGKSPHPYGKVHTRHLNQLFIRGENVLLINLQPLS